MILLLARLRKRSKFVLIILHCPSNNDKISCKLFVKLSLNVHRLFGLQLQYFYGPLLLGNVMSPPGATLLLKLHFPKIQYYMNFVISCISAKQKVYVLNFAMSITFWHSMKISFSSKVCVWESTKCGQPFRCIYERAWKIIKCVKDFRFFHIGFPGVSELSQDLMIHECIILSLAVADGRDMYCFLFVHTFNFCSCMKLYVFWWRSYIHAGMFENVSRVGIYWPIIVQKDRMK